MLRACVWLPIQLFKSQLFIQPFSSVDLRVGGWLARPLLGHDILDLP